MSTECTVSRYILKRLHEIVIKHMFGEPGDYVLPNPVSAPDFNIEEVDNFIVQNYYCSIGYCTPAALGVGLARPDKRPLVLTGDGAFQMTAQEVSSLIRLNCPALIIVINNDGYLVERLLHEDGPYNDLQIWNHANLPGVFDRESFAIGLKVVTEEELENAMKIAAQERKKLILIEACLPNCDCSSGLARLGKSFRQASAKKPLPTALLSAFSFLLMHVTPG